MSDRSGPGSLPELLDRLMTGIEVLPGSDVRPGIKSDPAISDLIDAHPMLLSPEADAELARRLGSAADEAMQQRIRAVRQVLQACREAGSTTLLRGSTDDRGRNSGPAAHGTSERVAATLSFLGTLSGFGKRFAEGGVLRASLAVVRGMLLNSLIDAPVADREQIRAAMLSELDEGLPLLWALQPSQELAGIQAQAGVQWAQRLHGNQAENLERAIACYQAALEVYSKDGTPHDWAATQNNLGVAYSERLREDKAKNLERAIACYQAALEVRSKDGTPHDWAATQNNLGNAYTGRLREDRAENQERAIACYHAALEVYSKDGVPHDWAMTQNNLGNAYRERLREDRAKNLERAIACYQAALEVRSKDGTPHQWAATQNNLGNAYRERLREDRAENLERAIAGYRAALEVYSKDGTPHDWAMTQNNLGVAYSERLRGDRAKNLERTIACYL